MLFTTNCVQKINASKLCRHCAGIEKHENHYMDTIPHYVCSFVGFSLIV